MRRAHVPPGHFFKGGSAAVTFSVNPSPAKTNGGYRRMEQRESAMSPRSSLHA
jgi:hypothetical protein